MSRGADDRNPRFAIPAGVPFVTRPSEGDVPHSSWRSGSARMPDTPRHFSCSSDARSVSTAALDAERRNKRFSMHRQMVRVLVVGDGLGGAARVLVPDAFVAATPVWRRTPYRHSQPLGLWPPFVHDGGEHLSHRWYCEDRGKSWPAVPERERGPVPGLTWYDQSKAAAANKRVHEPAERKRALAIERAGMDQPARQPTRTRVKPPPARTAIAIHTFRTDG